MFGANFFLHKCIKLEQAVTHCHCYSSLLLSDDDKFGN